MSENLRVYALLEAQRYLYLASPVLKVYLFQ